MIMAGYQMNGLVPFNNFNGLVPQLISQQYLSQQNNPANGPTIEKIAGKDSEKYCIFSLGNAYFWRRF